MAFSAYRSPAVAALPPSARLFQYDEDGDAIMTDAVTGSPIRYPGSQVAPWAPERLPSPIEPWIQEGELHDDVVRNLAQEMAEAVLQGEPRDDPAVPPFIFARIDDNPDGPVLPPPVPQNEFHLLEQIGQAAHQAQEEENAPPPGGEPAEEEEWCLSATVPELALRLDMRHPRVILHFLRFVSTYNELAPPGEEIHLPAIPQSISDYIFAHTSLVTPPAEFASEIAELRALINTYRCWCDECEDQERYFA